MPPRRKSARKVGQSEIEAEAEAASQEHNRILPSSGTSLSIVSLLDGIGVSTLSNLLPDASLDAPTPEAILQCYKLLLSQHEQLEARSREVEECQAECERKEIELDQALQDRETAVRELESSMGNVLSELNAAKVEKDHLAISCESLRKEVATLGTSRSASLQELETHKRKVDDVEREKRELLCVISRLEEDAAQREEEIVQLRENLKTARKEAQDSEANIREIRSAERSTAFKVETLTHQLQLARDENERISADFARKTEEFSTYRRDKHTEMTRLQSELDALNQTHSQILNSHRSLQGSHNSQSQQLSQALQKVQDLRSQLADQEARYSSEAVGLRRLVQMMEERENQAKQLVQGIEKEWEGLSEKTAARERKLRESLEEEREKSTEFEKQLEDMKQVLERVNRGELPLPGVRGGMPVEQHNTSAEGLLGVSPGLSMLSRMQKSGKTFTEVYTDYVRMQNELAVKTTEIDRLDRTLTEVLSELEERAPALAQQKLEIERSQAEAQQLATQLSRALAERDGFAIRIEEYSQKYAKAQRENQLQEQQLDDLSRQLKALLKELAHIRDPTIPSDEEMANIAPAENIDAVITNNLVLYRSIDQLQEQNQKLLKITRDLGARMETEEKDYKEQLDREQSEAIREAHEAIQALQQQLENQRKASQMTIEVYVKERDALKAVLSRYERSGTIVQPSTPTQVNGCSEPTEPGKELEEVRNNFESYKLEMGVDSSKLREEVIKYQREAGSLGASLAKANAKIEFLNERHRMTQEQYAIHERDYQALSNRNQQLFDQYTRLEIACNHATEELTAANSQIERLRTECSNLRAEKKIWENVQARLVEENKMLSIERSRMSDLMANVQKMQNDIDRANESDRRRFESQARSLEAQTQDLRTQLMQERDTIRQLTLQKDIESQELRTRFDRTMEDLSKSRELLAGAETSRKHLQERVDDLVKQIQMSEEKLAVYERRAVLPVSVSNGTIEDSTAEQDLRSEVAELKALLKSAEVDLMTGRSHVQQFQEISQASEAALLSLSQTHEEYKVSTEAQIIKFESQRKSLEERMAVLLEDLKKVNETNSELQQTLNKERAAFAQDKKTLEETIIDITNAEANNRADQATRECQVREQSERTRAVEERYAREVLAHAEAIKTIGGLKEELNVIRITVREKTMQAETAEANLATSEDSWRQQRDTLDKEVFDLKARLKDLVAQNALLHQHLEAVSSQASRIRQAADSTTEILSIGGEADDNDGRMGELRSVVAYLRKEKEIVDLQLELSKQENVRFKTQIEHLNQSLEETRSTLSKEREDAAKSLGNSTEHAELLERINQLNILRESNATLRAESEAHARKARQLETSLSQLHQELTPLKEEVKTLRAELEEKDRRCSRLEDENRQWKERSNQLLTKYDRIDPNDIQQLKDEIDDLQIDLRKAEEEKAKYTSEIQEMNKSLEGSNAEINELKLKHQSLDQNFRNRLSLMQKQLQKFNESNSELKQQVQELTTEKERLASQISTGAVDQTAELQSLQTQLQTATEEKEAFAKQLAEEKEKLVKTVAERNVELNALKEERDTLAAKGSVSQPPAEIADVTQARQQIEAERARLIKERDDALARLKMSEEQVAKIMDDVKNLRMQNEKFQERIRENEKRKLAESERLVAMTDKHKQEQEQAIAAATEKLRLELQTPSADIAQITTNHAEEMRNLEASLVAKHEKAIKAAVEKAQEEAAAAAAPATKEGAITLEAHEQALKQATEQGRLESAAKLKLKDSMLARAQANVKHYEAQIKSWKDSGILPVDAPTIVPPTAAPTAKAPVPAQLPAAIAPKLVPTASTSGTATAPASATATTPAQPAALPRKPSLNVTAAATFPDAASRGRGMARGIVRGVRGAARGASTAIARGGAPAAIAQAVASTSGEGGMSIMGAAAKRAREESETTDSLAKRIKPAEGAKPVALRRDRIQPTNTGAASGGTNPS